MSEALKLTPEILQFAEEQIEAGNFSSVTDVARAAFLLLKDYTARRAAVREKLEQLFDSMDAGEGIPTTREDFAEMVQAQARKLTD